jgi:hypothetical protein
VSEKLAQAINMAADALKADGGLQDGEEAVFALNDATLIMSKEDGHLSLNVILGEPIKLDIAISDELIERHG